jgi:hypothetical protein
MNANDDEWRIRIEVPPDQQVREIVRAIERTAPFDFEGGVRARYPVSESDDQIFIYTRSEPAAREALAEVSRVLDEHVLHDSVSLSRWHPIEERWENASVPLPETEIDEQRERARREELETQRSLTSGDAEWEVRITLPTREEARELEHRLRDEGIPVTRGWRHVMAGADNEDDAHSLAERLRLEAPEGSLLHVEPSGAQAWRITHPFPFFGGLGA